MNKHLKRFGLAAVLLVGCHDEPGLPRGHFELARTTVGKVPVVLDTDTSCVHTLLSGWIQIHDAVSYTSRFGIERKCGVAPARVDTAGVKEGRYRMNGDTASMYDDAGGFGGTFFAHGRDTLYGVGERWTLVYVRR